MRNFIAAVAVVLAAFVGWAVPRHNSVAIDVSPVENQPDIDRAAASSPSSGRVEARSREPLSNYAEIEQRILFSPTRRPPAVPVSKPVPQAAVPAVPAIDIGQFRLLGVLLRPGHKRALIRTPANPDGRWIGEGGSLDGALVRSITPDLVTLDAAGVTRTIKVQR